MSYLHFLLSTYLWKIDEETMCEFQNMLFFNLELLFIFTFPKKKGKYFLKNVHLILILIFFTDPVYNALRHRIDIRLMLRFIKCKRRKKK